MNRNDFIEELTKLYEDFTEKNIQARVEAYLLVLPEKINFDKLWQELIKNYDSFKFAPSPAYLKKIIEKMPKYGDGLF